MWMFTYGLPGADGGITPFERSCSSVGWRPAAYARSDRTSVGLPAVETVDAAWSATGPVWPRPAPRATPISSPTPTHTAATEPAARVGWMVRVRVTVAFVAIVCLQSLTPDHVSGCATVWLHHNTLCQGSGTLFFDRRLVGTATRSILRSHDRRADPDAAHAPHRGRAARSRISVACRTGVGGCPGGQRQHGASGVREAGGGRHRRHSAWRRHERATTRCRDAPRRRHAVSQQYRRRDHRGTRPVLSRAPAWHRVEGRAARDADPDRRRARYGGQGYGRDPTAGRAWRRRDHRGIDRVARTGHPGELASTDRLCRPAGSERRDAGLRRRASRV